MAAALAVLYYRIGERYSGRLVSHESRHALIFMRVWWYGLAVMALIRVVQLSLGALGVLDPPFHFAFLQGLTLAFAVALWGLTYGLLYVFTGRRALLRPIPALFGAAFLLG